MSAGFPGTGNAALTRALSFGSSSTVMFWFYPQSVSGYHDLCSFVSGVYAALFLQDDDIVFESGDGANGFATNLSTNTWYHVAVVRASNTVTVYLDGNSIFSVSATDTWNQMQLGLGYYSDDFYGRITAAKAWSAALDSTEVNAEIDNADPTRLTNLLGVWWMKNGTDYTLDSSGNNYHLSESGTGITDEADPSTSLLNYGSPATLTQEGFRWRDDDGSETGASWLDAQDTNISIEPETPVRIRFLIDADGMPAGSQFQLEYKLSSDSVWSVVQ